MNNMEISYQQAMQEMNELLSQFLWSHLQSLGLFREKHVVLTGLREQAGISTGYDRWLQESIALLERQQYLHCHDTTPEDGRAICTVVDPTLIESATLWQRWDQLKEDWMCHADLKAQVILVETTLRTLPAILTGQRPVTEVLFPNGSMQLVEGIYQHNATADYFNDVLATLLVIYLQERLTVEKHARIRILEIGAGTGGTTSRVLPMLQPYQAAVAEYCYSDISKSFLQYGQRMYGAEHCYPTYQLLNIEKPLAEQGIEAGSYDVVIATNVLHATSNIQRTVRNTKAALKKHGLLLLNEITGANLFAHLTFGLLEGWWAYEDPELRVPGCPALTAENWEAVLSSEGFRAISFPTRDMQEAGQQVIVAESDGVVRQARKQSDTNTRTSQSAVQAQTESRRSVAASNRKESDSHFITDQMVKDHVRSIILESIAEVLKVHEGMIQEERNFPEYGVDSIVALKLINVINQKGNLTLRVTVLFEYNSIEQLLQYILREHTAKLMATLQESVLARGSGVEGIQTFRSESTHRARHRVGTVACVPCATGLHDPYSNQNVEYLAQNIRHNRQWSRFQTPMPHHEPIAVIGMSGRFARSKTVNELWEHLANGTDLIEEVSRWDHAELDPVSAERRIPYCKHGSFLDGIDLFDPLFFNISGLEATYMDPQQRLVLEEGWKALEDAGYVGESIDGRRCGVYIGCVAGDYQLLFDGLPPAQAFWGNVDSVVPARIAYYLNLQGPAIAIDTACSSSLVAMHLACQGLWSGEMDIALAGGVYVQCTPQFYQRASSAGMLSATGHCSTFDDRADGFVPGEGVGIVVLKRLKDALASGDHIYGVIRGSGINQDGATTGITVPSANAQEQLERSVYETFQIDPSQIQMVEAHGTGTKLGDPIEYEALTRAFRKYTDHCQYCAIGSIKTNIGHTIATAGVAGVIKILLALQHRQIPPSLHFQSGNEHIQFKESPFYVNTRLKDWEIEGEEIQRCAAVSSFGFSGTNAHMVIEEAPEHLRRHAQRPGYLIVLSARTADQLRQQVEQLAAFCERSTKLDCGNISYTLLLGRKHLKHRLACIVRSHQELGTLLRNWLVKGKVPQISVSNLENRGQGENVSLRDYGNQCIENCQHWTASAPDIYLEKLSTVADLYLQGYRLAFEQLFSGGEYSRISLPTYPFAREHYWIPISKGTQATTVLSALHPLVQRNTSTLWEQRFSSTFRGDEFFLADHVIMGRRIMPGVVYLEMARAAIAAAWGRGRVPQVQATGADAPSLPNCLRLSRVVWARPLVVSAHPVTVHIALEVQESGTVTFLISEDGQGQEDGGLRTTDHLWQIGSAQGTIPTAPVRSVPLLLSRGTAELYEESTSGLIANQSLDLPAVQASCQHQIPVTEWYERSRSLGISYGPALQGIEQMSVGEDEVLARLRLPVAPGVSPGVAQTYAGGGGIGASHGIGIGARHDHQRRRDSALRLSDGYGPRLLLYVLHPSMLDAALQSCFALSMLGSSEHQDPHLPFELEEISIMGEMPAQGWAWGRQRPRSTAGSVFDIEVCDDEGRIVVRLRGLSSRTLQEAPALPTEQEARVCDSEAPDIRRDSSYESQQYKVQRLQHLSAPSLQAPFPRNDGEITDQMVRDHVQLILLESMAEVLQIDERNIEEDISFSEYGVDSIVAVNLINVINQKSHLSLQVTVLFDNNNIEQLVQHILREEMTTSKALLQDGRPGHSSVRRQGQALPLQDETAPGAQERLIDVGQGTSQRGLVGARMGASPAPTAPALSVPTATVRETGADVDRAERNVPITRLRTGIVGTRTGTSPVPTNEATQTTKGIDDLATHHEPIAIIGMSGRFAHSKTVSELWEHLTNGTDLVEEVSRWDLAELSPASEEKTEPYCKHGSFLEEIDLFDPLFFNISRHEAAYMDPQQRLVLEEAWKALEDAGYAGSSIEGRRCGVYIGCISGDYPHLFNDVPPAQAFWGNASSVIPARIAYYLNLQGPAIAIDAACSSSLVAIHLACQSLWNGETEMALAGGVFLQCTPQFYQSANRAGMLSVTGHCYTFDERADGFVPGEGVGIVVLKRLKDAVASGDHIYGVIRGSGINQDGTTRGITVPSANSQERLLRSVYETFQIDPAQIQMVEAHGTGTKLGDPIEYEALTRAFRKYTEKKEYCALGSIKTNLGHTATAAGAAGIIKILLSLQHKQIPPSLHFQSGNAHIQFKGSPFYVNTSLQDWRPEKRGPGSAQGTIPRRCAAISSFGFSGTNAHMVIEEAPECLHRHAEMPGYLIVLSARTSDQLRQQAEQLVAFCACTAEVDCGNMSYTLLLGRKHLKHRLACVVCNHKELEGLLRKWLEKGKAPQISVSNLENWELRETPSLKRYGNQCIEDCQRWGETVETRTGASPVPTVETYLEQLSTVADLYLQGYGLAFEQLFTGKGYSRISLPTYPFARERCWADEIITQPNHQDRRDSALYLSTSTDMRNTDRTGASPARSTSHKSTKVGGKELTPFLHPLVQRNTSTLWEQQFSSTFRGDEFFLADHVISGQRILPGVAYLEMAHVAVREATSADTLHEPIHLCLSHVMWVRPLIVGEHPITVHITLEPQESGTIAFLISRNVARQEPCNGGEEEATGGRQGLCQGTVELRTENATGLMTSQSLDLPAVLARCQHKISATECYQRYRGLGISHGPAFQGIEQLSVGEDEALARLRLPTVVAQTRTEFVLHPSVLDAALQACIGLLVKRPELQGPHLPFALEELSIVGEVPAVGWAWIRQRPVGIVPCADPVTGLVGKGLAPLFDIDVCDDAGRVTLFLRGLNVRPLPAEEETRTLLLAPNWKEEASLPAVGTRKDMGASLGSAGHSSLSAYPLTPVATPLVLLYDLPSIDASRIQAQLSESGHCHGLKVISWHSTQSRRELRFQDAVVQLIQELQHLWSKLTGYPQPAELTLVQVVVAHREEPSFLEALAGVLKTAQQEYPQLWGQLIEVEAEPKEEELLVWLYENQFRPQESHIRYRDSKRWVRLWQEVETGGAVGAGLAPALHPYMSIPWKEDGCYLISGGTGGLARLFVQEITQQVQKATVILVGRSDLSAVEVEKACSLWEVQGSDPGRGSSGNGIRIDYQQTDVNDGPAVYALIQRVLTQYGHLDGIIHAAGVHRDSLLLNKTQEEVEAVLAPKVIGVELLDKASERIPLDFFILCSSLSAIMGNVGQADYAGANAYLDAFAHARQTLVTAGQRQGATISINWPLWEAGGMQIEASERQTMQKRLGVEAMGTETGMKMLYQALASGLVQVVVAHGQVERIKQLLQHSSPDPSVGAWQAQGTVPTIPDSETWQDKLREALKHILSRMFKVRAEEINNEREFSEYGFDSVAFTQLANRLNQTYQLNLTPPLFFQYSTIERLAQYMQATHASVLAPYFAAASPVAPGLAPETRKASAQELVTTEEASFASLFARSRFRDYYRPLQFSEKKTLTAASSIAIIGMSGMFPQAPDVQRFWSNLLEGRDCISEIPQERWDWQTYFGSPTTEANKTNVKWAGILDGIELFDPLFFGISPREAEQMDPQQRLLMMYVWKAIEDAGYAASSLSGTNTALFIGTASSGYSELVSQARMPIEGYSSTSQTPSVGPNRMSYFLNLHGPSEPVETACSSSLVAIHRGVNAIESGQCTMAIVGGVNTLISPALHISFSKAGMLSEDGRCKPFSAQANGYGRGEGVGMLVLKKLSDAEQAGDHIYGVIRASAENHGGRASSLTAPNPRAQADLLITAYRKAGIDPRTVGYIEAHGTGTALGDPIEINGLKTAFSELTATIGEGPTPRAACGIGSVKSNIGHLELAAGIAGVIKVLLQLQHKKLVKSLHCEQLNPYIELEASPFYIVQENREWETLQDHTGKTLPRRAGISSFGFGGANAHVVLEEYVPKARATLPASLAGPSGQGYPEQGQALGRGQAPPLLIVLSAKNEERLQEQVQQLLDWMQSGTCAEEDLQDLAYTLQVGREAMEERLALQVNSLIELKEKLRRYLQEPQETGGWYRGQVRRHDAISIFAADEDGQKAVAAWMSKGKYDKLLRFWVKGGTIDWKHLYGESLPYRISLPTYPFAREHYWIPTGASPMAKATGSLTQAIIPVLPTLHPLVQRNISDFFEQRFSATFRGDEFFLSDHVVKGQRIMPGVAYLEMARAAIDQAMRGTTQQAGHILHLRQVVWRRPLVVDKEPIEVHITLELRENQQVIFTISSRTHEMEEEALNIVSQGSAELSVRTEIAQSLDLPTVADARFQRQISANECYQRFRELGISYGPALQGIEQLSVGEGEVLARLRLPVAPGGEQTHTEGDKPLPYVLHPSVLDAALQACIGFQMEPKPHQEPYLPFALEELSIMGQVQASGWALVHRRSHTATGSVFDIEVCDDEGHVVVHLRGLCVRQLPTEEETRTVLLTPDWKEEMIAPLGPLQQAPIPSKSLAPVALPLVLLCDLPNVQASHIQAQMAPGGRCRSLQSSPLRREQRFQEAVVQLIQELQHLLQSRPAGVGKELVPLLVQVVVNIEKPSFLEALASILKTVQQEYPKLQGQLIEVDGEPKQAELLAWLRENQSCPQESHIRYRNGKRWVREWQELPEVTPPRLPWKEGGCYLITGGAGGLARLFVQEIARQVQKATIILVGRSTLTTSQRTQLEKTEKSGIRIEYQQVDVNDGPAVHTLIQSVTQQIGHLDGIIHAAGTLCDSLLLNKTQEEVLAVLAPKVIGVEHLDEASREIPLDFLILCSSLSAIAGNVGQADYATANAYLDAFAHARAAQVAAGERQGATLSINWPLWQEGGMQIEAAARKMMRERLGIEVMEKETGMRMLYQALACGHAQVIVVHGQIERIKQQLLQRQESVWTGLAPLQEGLESTQQQERVTRVSPPSREGPALSPGEEQQESLKQTQRLQEGASTYFKKQLAALIKLPAQRLDPEAPLSDYGFDSIMAVRWISALEDTFGPLSKTLLFEYPTVQSLTEYFLHNHSEPLRSVLRIEEAPATVLPQATQGLTALTNRYSHRGTNASDQLQGTEGQAIAEVGVGGLASPTPTSAIAIIGMAGRYPGARDLQEFWENLRTGRDCITEIPAERWDHRPYFDPDKNKAGTTYSKWGGFIEGVDEFDPLFFNISPREAERTDPQEHLFLECAIATLEDAGYTPESYGKSQGNGLGGNVGVFVGVMYEEYQLFGAEEQSQGRPVALSGSPSSIANRVSYFCNFYGPSIALDTMCSSSLTALHLACQSIKHGDCKLAIAGGVNVSIHPNKYLLLGQGKFVSSQGHCQSFGQGADGYVPAEGVGAVLLKPLAQAEADGDHIYGVIKATAINHGGRTNGYTVPNPQAQADVIEKALKEAQIDPRTISYIEAHGTGTVLGDPIEIAGLTRAFHNIVAVPSSGSRKDIDSHGPPAGKVYLSNPKESSGNAIEDLASPPSSPAMPSQWCAIGSVKSNIGHAESAAGIAGLTKVLLQMQHGQIVPSLHAEQLNPYIDFAATPFVVQQELSTWKRPQTPEGKEIPKRAGISSFGAGGSNAHVILEEYIEKRQINNQRNAHSSSPALIVLSARTEEQLHTQVRQLLAWISARYSVGDGGLASPPSPQEVAYTLQVGRPAMEERLALLVNSHTELEEKLRSYLQDPHEGDDWYRGQVKLHDATGIFATDEDGQKAVAAWMSKGKYGKLLEFWVRGGTVDWKHLYSVGAGQAQGTESGQGTDLSLPRRISLPTYPFARQRYWFPRSASQMTTLTSKPSTHGVTLRPLVDSPVRLHGNNGQKWDADSTSLTASANGVDHSQPSVSLSRLDQSLPQSSSNDVVIPVQVPLAQNTQLTIPALEEELTKSLAQALYMEPNTIDVEKPFGVVGLDSVIGVEWVKSLNKQYASNLKASCVYDYPTIRQLAGFLQKELLKQNTRIQQTSVEPMSTLSLDDMLQQVQQGTLDIKTADQVLHQLYLSIGLSPDSHTQAKKERQ